MSLCSHFGPSGESFVARPPSLLSSNRSTSAAAAVDPTHTPTHIQARISPSPTAVGNGNGERDDGQLPTCRQPRAIGGAHSSWKADEEMARNEFRAPLAVRQICLLSRAACPLAARPESRRPSPVVVLSSWRRRRLRNKGPRPRTEMNSRRRRWHCSAQGEYPAIELSAGGRPKGQSFNPAGPASRAAPAPRACVYVCRRS
jgi:hypothetical protein